jgi:hypothetical protein
MWKGMNEELGGKKARSEILQNDFARGGAEKRRG